MNLKSSSFIAKIHPVAWQGICLTVSIAIFVLILANRSPNLLRPISMSLRTGFGIIIPVTALVIYAIFRIPGRLGKLLTFISVMSLFAFGLAGLWASGNTQSILISGLIPVSDAVAYYTDALRILHGIDISDFSAMRPFFPGFFSFLLWLAGRNLLVALGIFTAIAGIACYAVSREIHRTHGAETAVFFLLLMFLYFRHHSGTSMSETLGISVSMLGTALIWRGTSMKKEWLALFGIAMIALALNIRPGAMFVLPALLFWGGYVFRRKGRFSARFFLLGAMLILATFYLNNLMIKAMAGASKVAFANFSWALYGLASGGNSWTYIFEVHPELQLLGEAEMTPAIYRLALELIVNEPALMLKGAAFYWRMFFSSTWYNAYSFVAGVNFWVNEVARWGIYLLGAMGLVHWLRERRDPFTSLAVITAIGVLLSVPFVPPTDAYRVRLYAATIPFFALLPAMGISFLRERLKFRSLYPSNPDTSNGQLSVALSILIVTILIAAPIALKRTGNPPVLLDTLCPPDMDEIIIQFDEGTSVNILRESALFLDWMPNYHIGLFRRNAHSLADPNLIERMASIAPPSTIFYALDFRSNREALVIIKSDQLPPPGRLLHICGFWENNPAVIDYRIFQANYTINAP